jgi:septum formation protein
MLGLDHEVLAVDVSEEFGDGETPESHVERLAGEKAVAGSSARPQALVLAGDTVVVLDGDVLGKPAGVEEAVDTLLRLSGRTHVVYSALALVEPGGSLHSRVDHTHVTFRAFDETFARAYAETGEPLDKAGAYGIQGMGAALVSGIDGDYYTVVGLSVTGLLFLLERAGLRYSFGKGVSASAAHEA